MWCVCVRVCVCGVCVRVGVCGVCVCMWCVCMGGGMWCVFVNSQFTFILADLLSESTKSVQLALVSLPSARCFHTLLFPFIILLS